MNTDFTNARAIVAMGLIALLVYFIFKLIKDYSLITGSAATIMASIYLVIFAGLGIVFFLKIINSSQRKMIDSKDYTAVPEISFEKNKASKTSQTKKKAKRKR